MVVQSNHQSGKLQGYPEPLLPVEHQPMGATFKRHVKMIEQFAIEVKLGHFIHVLPGDKHMF